MISFVAAKAIVRLIFSMKDKYVSSKNKSEINMMAAETLFEKCLYPSCCHPAYYSCVN